MINAVNKGYREQILEVKDLVKLAKARWTPDSFAVEVIGECSSACCFGLDRLGLRSTDTRHRGPRADELGHRGPTQECNLLKGESPGVTPLVVDVTRSLSTSNNTKLPTSGTAAAVVMTRSATAAQADRCNDCQLLPLAGAGTGN